MLINKNFTNGRIIRDVDERLHKSGDYKDATNIRVTTSASGNVGAVENVQGNEKISNLGLTNCIEQGSYADETNEKIYWFISSDEKNAIVEYDKNTTTVSYVLEHTTLLDFSRIRDVNLINDLLFWIDETNAPRKINITRAKTYGLDGFTEIDISVIKSAPGSAPGLTLTNTSSTLENNLEEKFLMFSYRYEFIDGEFSAPSPFSSSAFSPQSTYSYDFSTSSNESMVNKYNAVDIEFDCGNRTVKSIELLFKESGSDAVYIVERFDKEKLSYADDSLQTFTYDNSKYEGFLPLGELDRFCDFVPLQANSQELIGKELCYGNYIEHYDIEEADGTPIEIDFDVEIVSTAVTGVANSLKSNRDYELGKVYKDGQGRYITPLTSKNNTAYVENADAINQNQIKVTTNNIPPPFATHYTWFIKQSKVDYETIIPTQFYEEGSYRWIKLEYADRNKIEEGTQLIIKADSSGILTDVNYTKVLEIKEQEKNFISNVVIDPDNEGSDITEESGLYFKIKPNGFRMNREDFSFYEFDSYDNSSNDYDDPIRSQSAIIEDAIYYGQTGVDDLVSSGAYSGGSDIRYLIEIDGLAVEAEGTVTLDSGASGSVDGITVNGVQIMSGAESFDTDLGTTATNVAANITAHTSSPNYTADAAGSIITITAVDKGSDANGFAVVSSVTTIATTDVNMASGSYDTFKWSKDNGGSWEATTVEITETVAQTLDNGVEITFASGLDHDTDDSWVVGGKISMPESASSKAYGFFKSVDTEEIYGGARINMIYDEYEEGSTYVPVLGKTASGNFANLEEWYFGDGIEGDFTPIPAANIYFRRGLIGNYGSAQYFTQDPSGVMVMIIESIATQNNDFDDRVKVRAHIDIFQSDDAIIFETKPEDLNPEAFFEIGETFEISGGYHQGSTQNQTGGQPAISTLNVFNCFSFGNGVESYKIKDAFNAKSMKMDTRPLIAYNNYKRNYQTATLIHSEPYVEETNYNGLNTFNLSKGITKSLNTNDGAIQKLHFRDDNILVLQEDKVGDVLYRKTEYNNIEGENNIVKTNTVLGSYRAYKGEYGISQDNETFVSRGNRSYWIDSKRGCPVRLSINGIDEIHHGLFEWWKDLLNTNTFEFKTAVFDPFYDEYIVSVVDGDGYKTIAFSETPKGWTSFYTFEPEGMVGMNNELFSFKGGELYKHHSDDADRCNFYETANDWSITPILSDNPGFDKIYKTFNLESTTPFEIELTTNLTNGSVKASEFVKKESWYYSNIKNTENANDYSGGNVVGIGEIVSFDGLDVTFPITIGNNVAVGDQLKMFFSEGDERIIGTIVAISENTITVDAVANAMVNGTFVFGVKNARIEGSNIRGYYLESKLTSSEVTPQQLFAVNINTILSRV